MKGRDGKFLEIWADVEKGNQDLEIPLVFQNLWRTTVWEIKDGEISCYGNYYEVDEENKFTSFKEAIQKARAEARRLRQLGYLCYVSSASSKAKFRIKTIREELLMSALPIYQGKDYRETYSF